MESGSDVSREVIRLLETMLTELTSSLSQGLAMRTSQPRKELLAFFARQEARARSETRAARREQTELSPHVSQLTPAHGGELPFEPDPQHSCVHGSQASRSTPTREPAPMETDPALLAAFSNKYPDATTIKVVRASLWERVLRVVRPLPIEVWISLPNGSVRIEKRNTTEELLAIAERREA